MSNFMMNVVSWILLLLVILTLYLIDKVNQLTRLQQEALHPGESETPATDPNGTTDVLFERLHGKNLWDAMCGKPIEGIEPQLVDALRPHYEPVLMAHVEHAFQQGLASVDSAAVPRNPESVHVVHTPRGQVQSWLPAQHLGSLYRTAREFAGDYRQDPMPETLQRLRETLDSVAGMLFQRAGLPLDTRLSETWLDPETLASAEAAQPPGAVPALPGVSAAQGAEQVAQYEAQQRQDVAAEHDATVLEPVLAGTAPELVKAN